MQSKEPNGSDYATHIEAEANDDSQNWGQYIGHLESRCERAERERDELKDEWDKLLYINGVLKILGDSGLTPEQSVVELGKRLKDTEAERDELLKQRAADVAMLAELRQEIVSHLEEPADWSMRVMLKRLEAALRAKGEL